MSTPDSGELTSAQATTMLMGILKSGSGVEDVIMYEKDPWRFKVRLNGRYFEIWVTE